MKVQFGHFVRGILLTVLFISSMIGCTIIDPNASSDFLYAVDNISDNDDGNLELYGAGSATAAVVGGATYLFVAGYSDDGLSAFSVDNDGTLSNVFNVGDNDNLKLKGAQSVTTAVVGGATYLFVAGYSDNGVSVFSIGSDGALDNVTNISDDNNLKGARSVTTAAVEGTTYLFVARSPDDGIGNGGVSVFSVGDNGDLNNVFNVNNGIDTWGLKGARSVATAVVKGTTYLFVAGSTPSSAGGVSVFSVADDGTLNNVLNVSDNDNLKLRGAYSITAAAVEKSTYLFVAGRLDNGMSVFSIDKHGNFDNVTNISDDNNLKLKGAHSVTTTVVKGITYLFVAGYTDSGVSVFSVADDGTLDNVFNVNDNDNLKFQGTTSVSTVGIKDITYLFVTGESDNGVSVFSVNP